MKWIKINLLLDFRKFKDTFMHKLLRFYQYQYEILFHISFITKALRHFTKYLLSRSTIESHIHVLGENYPLKQNLLFGVH